MSSLISVSCSCTCSSKVIILRLACSLHWAAWGNVNKGPNNNYDSEQVLSSIKVLIWYNIADKLKWVCASTSIKSVTGLYRYVTELFTYSGVNV